MVDARNPQDAPTAPLWIRRPEVPHFAAYTVAALVFGGQIVAALVRGSDAPTFLAVLLAGGGVALSWWRPWAGLAVTSAASFFLGKTVSPAELVAGIVEVVAGGGTLSAAATAALIGHMSDNPPPAVDKELLRRFDALTPRERDVVVLVASGLGNDEIAARLRVSPYTVKTHAVRAMTKVGARDRAQLVSFTFLAGLYP